MKATKTEKEKETRIANEISLKIMYLKEQQLPIEFDFFAIFIIELKQYNDFNDKYECDDETYGVDNRVEVLRLLQFLQTFLFILYFDWLCFLLSWADH